MSGRIMADAADDPAPPQPTPQPDPPARPPPPPPPTPEPPPPPAREAEPEGEPDETAAEPQGEVKPADLPPDIQKRLDRATWEKYEARRQLEETQARLAQIERERAQALRPDGGQDPVETAKAQLRAEAREREFNAACNEVARKGHEEYGADFGDAMRSLNAVGYGNRPDALDAIASLPDGHRVYRALAADLDNAARVLSLPPMKMAMELARMSQRAAPNGETAAPAAPLPSLTRAPEPQAPIRGTSRSGPVPLEKTSMADFIRRRDAEEKRSRIMR